jgi:hypothetical protein
VFLQGRSVGPQRWGLRTGVGDLGLADPAHSGILRRLQTSILEVQDFQEPPGSQASSPKRQEPTWPQYQVGAQGPARAAESRPRCGVCTEMEPKTPRGGRTMAPDRLRFWVPEAMVAAGDLSTPRTWIPDRVMGRPAVLGRPRRGLSQETDVEALPSVDSQPNPVPEASSSAHGFALSRDGFHLDRLAVTQKSPPGHSDIFIMQCGNGAPQKSAVHLGTASSEVGCDADDEPVLQRVQVHRATRAAPPQKANEPGTATSGVVSETVIAKCAVEELVARSPSRAQSPVRTSQSHRAQRPSQSPVRVARSPSRAQSPVLTLQSHRAQRPSQSPVRRHREVIRSISPTSDFLPQNPLLAYSTGGISRTFSTAGVSRRGSSASMVSQCEAFTEKAMRGMTALEADIDQLAHMASGSDINKHTQEFCLQVAERMKTEMANLEFDLLDLCSIMEEEFDMQCQNTVAAEVEIYEQCLVAAHVEVCRLFHRANTEVDASLHAAQKLQTAFERLQTCLVVSHMKTERLAADNRLLQAELHAMRQESQTKESAASIKSEVMDALREHKKVLSESLAEKDTSMKRQVEMLEQQLQEAITARDEARRKQKEAEDLVENTGAQKNEDASDRSGEHCDTGSEHMAVLRELQATIRTSENERNRLHIELVSKYQENTDLCSTIKSLEQELSKLRKLPENIWSASSSANSTPPLSCHSQNPAESPSMPPMRPEPMECALYRGRFLSDNLSHFYRRPTGLSADAADMESLVEHLCYELKSAEAELERVNKSLRNGSPLCEACNACIQRRWRPKMKMQDYLLKRSILLNSSNSVCSNLSPLASSAGQNDPMPLGAEQNGHSWYCEEGSNISTSKLCVAGALEEKVWSFDKFESSSETGGEQQGDVSVIVEAASSKSTPTDTEQSTLPTGRMQGQDEPQCSDPSLTDVEQYPPTKEVRPPSGWQVTAL